MKKNIIAVFMMFCISLLRAQDVQFSQYYNLIQFQNPAFVGSSYAWRASAHARMQWPSLDARYLTTVFTGDYNLAKYKSGLGLMLVSDDQGGTAIKTYKGLFQYSYRVDLTPKAVLRSGVSVGLASRTLNNADLYYPGQFTGSGFDNSGNVPQISKNYIDLSAGLLFHTEEFWLGLSGTHLNRPNQSFIGNMERLPMQFDVLTGYKFTLKSNATMRYLENKDEDVWTLYPTILYKWQGKSDQLDLGLFSIYNIFKVGVWYRGVPIKNYNERLINNEAFIVLVGLKFDNLAINYSYDIGISKLGPLSRGAHEINLTYLYPKLRKNKSKYKYKRLPCPDFYGF